MGHVHRFDFFFLIQVRILAVCLSPPRHCSLLSTALPPTSQFFSPFANSCEAGCWYVAEEKGEASNESYHCAGPFHDTEEVFFLSCCEKITRDGNGEPKIITNCRRSLTSDTVAIGPGNEATRRRNVVKIIRGGVTLSSVKTWQACGERLKLGPWIQCNGILKGYMI